MSQMNPFIYSGVSPGASEGMSQFLALMNQGNRGGGRGQPNIMLPPSNEQDPLQLMEGAKKIDYRFDERGARQDHKRAMEMARFKQSGELDLLAQEQSGRMSLENAQQAGRMALESEQQAGRMALAKFEQDAQARVAQELYDKTLALEIAKLKAANAPEGLREETLQEEKELQLQVDELYTRYNQALADLSAVQTGEKGARTQLRKKRDNLGIEVENERVMKEGASANALQIAPNVLVTLKARKGGGKDTQSFGKFMIDEGIARTIEGLLEQVNLNDPNFSAVELQNRVANGDLSLDMLLAGFEPGQRLYGKGVQPRLEATPENVARARNNVAVDLTSETVRRVILANPTPVIALQFDDALNPLMRRLGDLSLRNEKDPNVVRQELQPLFEKLAVTLYGAENAQGRMPEVYLLVDAALSALDSELLKGPIAEAASFGPQTNVNTVQTRALANSQREVSTFRAYTKIAFSSYPTLDSKIRAHEALSAALAIRDGGAEELVQMMSGVPGLEGAIEILSPERALAQTAQESKKKLTDVEVALERARRDNARVVGDAERMKNESLIGSLMQLQKQNKQN